jgi:hypothetical protein
MGRNSNGMALKGWSKIPMVLKELLNFYGTKERHQNFYGTEKIGLFFNLGIQINFVRFNAGSIRFHLIHFEFRAFIVNYK